MIKTLLEWKLIQENKLVPRNLDNRLTKLKQQNYKLLQQKEIDDNLYIEDDSWNFSEDETKIERIHGSVTININYIPRWLKKVRVDGSFYADGIELTSLDGCSHTIMGNFFCNSNKLTSLVSGPEIVGGTYSCSNNRLMDLKGLAISMKELMCYGNDKTFTMNDIPPKTDIISGDIEF